MQKEICLDGKEICNGIKARVRDINKKFSFIPKLTLIGVCRRARVSIYTFRSWRMGRNPSFDSLKKIYAVLDHLEHGGE